jgi:hypothetical protein
LADAVRCATVPPARIGHTGAQRETNVNGMIVFSSLIAALNAGFSVYERTAYGYLMRTRTERGFALAIVDLNARRR